MNFNDKLRRLWRHLTSTSARGHAAFPTASLRAIEAAIAAGEALHNAEVQLIVEARLPPGQAWDGVSARERAAELFSHYRLWDTQDNCGILVYINLAERKVEVIADRGVAPLLSQQEWAALCGNMTAGFARGAYEASVLAALAELHALLQARYPRRGPARNELGNQPVVL
jgi:uncharacterized membrane protein